MAVAGADGGVRVGGLDGPLREVMRGESVLALSFVGDRLVVAEAGGRISVRPCLQGVGFYRCGLTRKEGMGLIMRDL